LEALVVMSNFIIILILFAVLFRTFMVHREMREQRKIAIQKGVSPHAFTLFTVAATLYSVPFIVYFIFRLHAFESLWFPFVILFSYTPAPLLADTIRDKMERGYDFQRKAAQRVKETELTGYFGLASWLIMWLVFHFWAN